VRLTLVFWADKLFALISSEESFASVMNNKVRTHSDTEW